MLEDLFHAMKVRSLLLVAACFLLSACVPYLVTDTPSARGQVVDARTHRPVVGARVCFLGADAAGTVTDTQGRFFLAERRKVGFLLLLPHNVPGPPTVEIRKSHYQPLQARDLFGPANEPPPAPVALQPVL